MCFYLGSLNFETSHFSSKKHINSTVLFTTHNYTTNFTICIQLYPRTHAGSCTPRAVAIERVHVQISHVKWTLKKHTPDFFEETYFA